MLALPYLALLSGVTWTPSVLAAPTFAEVRSTYTPSEASLLARDGQLLQSQRVDMTVRRLSWTPLSDISPALIKMVIASEDKRFAEHGGIDWRAAGNAAWGNIRGNHMRGASTISMQLAGLLAENNRAGRRNVLQKIGQATVALQLESAWNKNQILEAYLNLLHFRGELQGVAAMSRQLFGKWPDGLDERESAIAAVLIRSPNAAPAQVVKRACSLLNDLKRPGECASLEGFATLALAARTMPIELSTAGKSNQAPHLARKLLTMPGQRVQSTLNANIQAAANASLKRQLVGLARENAEDGAVLVIDNASGEVLAWVGSSGALSQAADVDGVTALRQPGSTLKPFLFGLAIEQRRLTAASLLEDASLALPTTNGIYAPQDYEANYRGWVSARSALAGSLNVPAVKTLMRVGTDAFVDRLQAFGLASIKENGDYYGYSLALGSPDTSLLMLANAYRTLANGGRWSPLRVLRERRPPQQPEQIPSCAQSGCQAVFSATPRQVLQPESAYIVGDILSDRNARAATFGLVSWLATPYWAAVKTGTSKDMRDNWCIGYSRRYTVAVWVGNAAGQPMRAVSGVSGAAPIWREMMDYLHQGDNSQASANLPPPAPTALIKQQISFEPAIEPPRMEWFLPGTQYAAGVQRTQGQQLTRIAYPTAGMILALDPDIPPIRQKLPLLLSTNQTNSGWRWRMNDQWLGKIPANGKPLLWLPKPGKHALSLHDADGTLIETVSFKVSALKAGKKYSRR